MIARTYVLFKGQKWTVLGQFLYCLGEDAGCRLQIDKQRPYISLMGRILLMIEVIKRNNALFNDVELGAAKTTFRKRW